MANVGTPFEIEQTERFGAWLFGPRDGKARTLITARVTRLRLGNFGDVKSLGGKVSELRIDYGPGYRVYLTRRGKTICLLLCGGDKKSQAKDIAVAKQMIKEL